MPATLMQWASENLTRAPQMFRRSQEPAAETKITLGDVNGEDISEPAPAPDAPLNSAQKLAASSESPDPFAREAKHFTEIRVLHREGLAKYMEWSASMLEADAKLRLMSADIQSKKTHLGQSRSLLTQAARHHAAQLCFFRKALSSLERVEPDLKSVTEHHHIDYQFSGLEDDDMDSVNNDESESSSYGDGELSFDYGRDDQGRNAVSTPRESMEIVNAPRAAVGSPTDKFEVFYIDYGNQEEVSYSQIRLVDPLVSSAPGLAQLCSLAHIKVPTLEEDYGHEAAFRLSELTLNGP